MSIGSLSEMKVPLRRPDDESLRIHAQPNRQKSVSGDARGNKRNQRLSVGTKEPARKTITALQSHDTKLGLLLKATIDPRKKDGPVRAKSQY